MSLIVHNCTLICVDLPRFTRTVTLITHSAVSALAIHQLEGQYHCRCQALSSVDSCTTGFDSPSSCLVIVLPASIRGQVLGHLSMPDTERVNARTHCL